MDATAAPVLRAWGPSDAPAVADLLEPGADPLWAAQFHALHGPPRDGERWRRTLVAETDGWVLGAATVARNRVHPDRYSCAVDVHPDWRRRGIGRRLLAAVRAVRPGGLPLASKLRPSNAAGLCFLAAAGGRVKQRCPGQVVDPTDLRVLAWTDRHGTPAAPSDAPGLAVGGLEELTVEQVADAFAEQYLWVHSAWSPVPPGPPRRALPEVAAATAADVDRVRSSGVWWWGRLVAAVLVFPADGGWEAVAETVVPEVGAVGVPIGVSGVALLRAALGRTFTEVARLGAGGAGDGGAGDGGVGDGGVGDGGVGDGGGWVELDGHVDDPHLQTALDGLPVALLRPLLLVDAP
ncbi:GNAT family N-acetyltransferase [Quadrisphaera setariae]|uniref:GNAT family N-acetyltransferase n=1 Tax=Quadrisphaera setariae TaxID=2593304 RepID=A0A5C8Z325_9ACTN|nr:GNAT family N-acetyltransferase [Quadrisphaera setariae]TXR51659.1 GNAT family N-acetyltransferase [Quadrisphaera setariae]